MTLESGHYQPTMRHMANAVRGLRANGLSPGDLRNVVARILDKKDPQSAIVPGSDFYSSLRALKQGRPPLGAFAKWMAKYSIKATDPRIADAVKVVP